MTPIEYADIRNRPITTSLAGTPICSHRERGSQPMAPPSCSNKNAHTCNCKNIVFFLLRVEFIPGRNGGSAPPAILLAQREVHVDLSHHLHRLSVQERRRVHPLFHRLQ